MKNFLMLREPDSRLGASSPDFRARAAVQPAVALAPAPAPPGGACPACVTGPSGIEGHQGLRATALGGASMRFGCRQCALLWSRTGNGIGVFDWKPLDGSVLATRTTWSAVALPVG